MIATGKQKLNGLQLDELISGLPNLAASCEILPGLLRLLDDPEADCNDLAEIIRLDVSLTAALLRVANSAALAGERKARSLSEAVSRLGMREVYRVVLEIVTAPVLKGPDASLFGRVDLWRHSLATAVAAQTLAAHLTDEDPEVVFTAGLLHDIGKTALVRVAREDYAQLLDDCAENNWSVEATERRAFQTDHAVVGGRLLRAWKFPEQITAAVAAHHTLYTVCEEHRRLAVLVWVGNIVAYRLGVGNGYPPYVAEPDVEMLRVIGLEAGGWRDFEEEILMRLQTEQERL